MPAWPVPYQIPSLGEVTRAAKKWEKKGVWLRQVGQVVLPEIPEWARARAMKGLTLTDTTIWLSRKYARRLYREARQAGIPAKLTYAYYRPCPLCGRVLLGMEAEERARLDMLRDGRKMPCGVDCDEVREARKAARQPKLANSPMPRL